MEKIVKKEEISRKIKLVKESKAYQYKFYKVFYDDGEELVQSIQEQGALLKKRVLDKLLVKTNELTSKKIKKRELKIIYDYTIADISMGDPEKEAKLILDKQHYCNRCGFCCVETSPINMSSNDYERIISVRPELKGEITRESGEYRFQQDLPCKFYDTKNKICDIYDIRPSTCRNYPINKTPGMFGITFAGDCELMVRYVYDRCEAILEKCLN